MEHLMDCLLPTRRSKNQRGLCRLELETTVMADSFLDISSRVRISSNTGAQGFWQMASDVIHCIHCDLACGGETRMSLTSRTNGHRSAIEKEVKVF